MIDTIVLRIHGYEKYKHIVTQLEQYNQTSYVKKFNHPALQNVNKTSILYADTDRVLDLSHRSTINVPSSHYSISFVISKERDFIEFNFSIPKYLYSTNVMQFIDQHDPSTWHTFDKLLNVLTRFFDEYFVSPPNWLDVEVNRIDLCYNQFFLSKHDALRYLDQQRNLNVQYARSDTNKFSEYGGTAVQYKTDNYSFKIYHKGTEFRKNDRLKLIKNNPKGFDIEDLSEKADKILRYEITCRKGLLNYIFKQKLMNDEYTEFHRNLRLISKSRTSARNQIMSNFKNGGFGVSVSSRNPIDLFFGKTLPNKTFQFNLDSLWNSPCEKPIDLLTNYSLPFTHQLFQNLHSFFWERVQKYQLGVKLGIHEIRQKIKEHQEDKEFKNKLFATKEKIAQTGQLLMIATLSQYTDITELKGVLPKATYYRYRKKLKELGIPEHSPDIAVLPPALDYSQYFYYFGDKHVIFN